MKFFDVLLDIARYSDARADLALALYEVGKTDDAVKVINSMTVTVYVTGGTCECQCDTAKIINNLIETYTIYHLPTTFCDNKCLLLSLYRL